MRTCLRKLVNVAESKESELSFALQDIERHLVFCGFGSETLMCRCVLEAR